MSIFPLERRRHGITRCGKRPWGMRWNPLVDKLLDQAAGSAAFPRRTVRTAVHFLVIKESEWGPEASFKR